MTLSHVVSDSILCVTVVLSLLWYRRHLSGELRVYLSITVALIGATALLGALRFTGFAELAGPTDTAARLGETVGIAALALAFWSMMVAPVPPRVAIGLLAAAFLVFVGVLALGMNALSLPFQAAGILTLLFLAITRRGQYPEASKWLGAGLLAFVAGAVAHPALADIVDTPVLRSLDIYHYCVVAAILAISCAATSLSRDEPAKPTRDASPALEEHERP